MLAGHKVYTIYSILALVFVILVSHKCYPFNAGFCSFIAWLLQSFSKRFC